MVVVVLALLLRAAGSRTGGTPADDGPAARVPSDPGPVALPPEVVLDGGACLGGYLCSALAGEAEPRAVRWPDGIGPLRIRVPLPTGVPAERASALQREAAAGIREWQGHPLPLQVMAPGTPGAAHVEVRWVDALSGDRLGHTAVAWRSGPGGPEMQVRDFVLALRDPSGAPVEPRRLRLTAAHEMGHALGLPHSDDRGDVMFPYNTSTRLTARDFRTVEILYGLPAGVRLRLPER